MLRKHGGGSPRTLGVEVSGGDGKDQWQKGWKAVTGGHTKKKKTYQDKMSAELSAELSTTVDSHECDFLQKLLDNT